MESLQDMLPDLAAQLGSGEEGGLQKIADSLIEVSFYYFFFFFFFKSLSFLYSISFSYWDLTISP